MTAVPEYGTTKLIVSHIVPRAIGSRPSALEALGRFAGIGEQIIITDCTESIENTLLMDSYSHGEFDDFYFGIECSQTENGPRYHIRILGERRSLLIEYQVGPFRLAKTISAIAFRNFCNVHLAVGRSCMPVEPYSNCW
ncbi:hypothetical protein V1527DRAFT_296889 [Lipomyces starkeyi]